MNQEKSLVFGRDAAFRAMKSKQIVIGISGLAVARGDLDLLTYSLGSCVGICMYDMIKGIGGMAHCLLPSSSVTSKNLNYVVEGRELGKYVDVAIRNMLVFMQDMGAVKSDIMAKVYGGADMFGSMGNDLPKIGKMNGEAALKDLSACGIPVTYSELGGNSARTITLHVESGEVQVKITPKVLSGNK